MTEAISINTQNSAEDQELLVLGQQLEQIWDFQKLVFGADKAGKLELTDGQMALVHEMASPIVEKIIRTKACTVTGYKVKARAVLWCHSGENPQLVDPECATTDFDVVHSILGDLLGAAADAHSSKSASSRAL